MDYNIDKYIEELLYHYDCVIIPRFGGFVANPIYSRINNVQNMFYPPSKTIGFNPDLKINDGLLASYISNAQNISYSEAIAMIDRKTNEWTKTLGAGGKVTINNIGIFSYDYTKKIQFEPNTNINFNLESYGLPVFQAMPVKVKNKEEAIRQHLNQGKRLITSKKSKSNYKTLFKSLLFVIPVLFLIGFGIINYEKINNANFNIASLNPFKVNNETTASANKTIQETPDINNINENSLSETENFAENEITETNEILEETKSPAEIEKTEETSLNTNVEHRESSNINNNFNNATQNKYYIIGGCFRELANAKQYIQETQDRGYNAFIVDKAPNGLYRVAIAGTDDYNYAMNNLNILKQNFQGAWLLSK